VSSDRVVVEGGLDGASCRVGLAPGDAAGRGELGEGGRVLEDIGVGRGHAEGVALEAAPVTMHAVARSLGLALVAVVEEGGVLDGAVHGGADLALPVDGEEEAADVDAAQSRRVSEDRSQSRWMASVPLIISLNCIVSRGHQISDLFFCVYSCL
jgi:hypothetical protein